MCEYRSCIAFRDASAYGAEAAEHLLPSRRACTHCLYCSGMSSSSRDESTVDEFSDPAGLTTASACRSCTAVDACSLHAHALLSRGLAATTALASDALQALWQKSKCDASLGVDQVLFHQTWIWQQSRSRTTYGSDMDFVEILDLMFSNSLMQNATMPLGVSGYKDRCSSEMAVPTYIQMIFGSPVSVMTSLHNST